jgi:peptidoglycan hydrolase CwlO-like protein
VSDDAYLKIPIVIPQLETIMATLEEVRQAFSTFTTEISAKLDAIDDKIDEMRAKGDADQADIDALADEVQAARDKIAEVNPSDPSGDDTPAT